jgi:hypothetical protein
LIIREIPVFVALLAAIPACRKGNDIPSVQEKNLFGGYLPDCGLSRFGMNNRSCPDRVNYFSLTPSVNGGFYARETGYFMR